MSPLRCDVDKEGEGEKMIWYCPSHGTFDTDYAEQECPRCVDEWELDYQADVKLDEAMMSKHDAD